MLNSSLRGGCVVPLYEYECAKDGRFELIRRFSDPPLKTCPKCGRVVEKLAAAPAFHLKGSGWYVTDYARKSKGGDEGKTENKAGESKADSKPDSKGESKPAETKSADAKSTESSASKDAKTSTPSTSKSKESSASKGSSPT